MLTGLSSLLVSKSTVSFLLGLCWPAKENISVFYCVVDWLLMLWVYLFVSSVLKQRATCWKFTAHSTLKTIFTLFWTSSGLAFHLTAVMYNCTPGPCDITVGCDYRCNKAIFWPQHGCMKGVVRVFWSGAVWGTYPESVYGRWLLARLQFGEATEVSEKRGKK